ncbi:MAG: S41 family peptidase [Actinobacteria bacterium]|nr:S41 family peptidase [Actinomycetota bacterium]MCL5882783.1 S41 family peptidase [Actinomycetota bacterium]
MPRFFRVFFISLAVAVAFLAGIYFGGHYYRLSVFIDALPHAVQNFFFPGNNTLQLEREIENILEEGFYQPVDSSTLENGAITGMVSSVNDPYTTYFNPDDFQMFNEHSSGQFTGIGVLMEQKDGQLRVVQVFDNSPAQEAGIQAGDVIVVVDGQAVAGKSQEETSALIRGPSGSQVALSVQRGAQQLDFTMTRREINLPIVTDTMIQRNGKNIGYIRLEQFSTDSGVKVKASLDKLIAQGAQGIILDLRNNGGGLLSESVTVGSAFIQSGPIVSVVGRDGQTETFQAQGNANETVPMVVLVNGNTASASEIVAGAIKDDARGKLIGEKTFGKGVVQNIVPLSNGGGLKFTSGSYHTPNGTDINKIGIEPDIPVTVDPASTVDQVLERGLAELAP